MSKKTVLNESYKGLVERFSIPAELHEQGDQTYASFGSVVPIHCCTDDEIVRRAKTTHHYCDIFTDEVLAPIEELAYVRLDENKAEKVFINRSKRIVMVSADGTLAQWRCAATFESANTYLPGTPVVNKDGALISVLTVKRGKYYAVSSLEGEGGYFDTSLGWEDTSARSGALLYGDRQFRTRDELRDYVLTLDPLGGPDTLGPNKPVLIRTTPPRLALVAPGGRQLAHYYLHNVVADGVEYL